MNDSLDVTAKYIAAGSTEASISDLEEWTTDSSAAVRRHVAENSRTPLHCLTVLAKDACSDVRVAVAENRYTPKWLLEEFLFNDDEDLRYSMAENSALPKDLLETLTQDENPYVAHRAKCTLTRLTPAKSKLLHMKRFEDVDETIERIWQVRIS